jgi:SAM-dependent methyltransferase
MPISYFELSLADNFPIRIWMMQKKYLVSCFDDRLFPSDLSEDAEVELMNQIEANFSILIRPWLDTCGFPPNQRNFLEIGCGDGKYGYFISRYVAQYIGIDLREAAIERAKKLLSNAENCRVMCGNGTDYAAIPDESQHLVFSYQTFVHMPDQDVIRANLKEIVRVLAQEGEARIQLLGPAFKPGWRIVWRKLSLLGAGRVKGGCIGQLLEFVKKILPGDFLIPSLRRKSYESHWGKFGAWISPPEIQKLMQSLGVNSWISPSCYGSRYAGYDRAIYWLVIAKGRDQLPFYLTLD